MAKKNSTFQTLISFIYFPRAKAAWTRLMPLSGLATSAFTATTIVRRYSNGVATLCSHGFHGRHMMGLANGLDHRSPTGPRKAPMNTKSAFSHLSSHRNMLSSAGTMYIFTQTTTIRNSSPAPNAVAPSRTRMICSHPNFVSDLNDLFQGNQEYMARMSKDHPGLLARLAIEGQKPPFMLIDCSDSRVNEQDIFSAQPGTIFTAGNIANRFDEEDLNSNSVLSFAVETLKVRQMVVLGHYGCGGVAASMMPAELPTRPADVAVQSWIQPIREIYETSSRSEIVAHREKAETSPITELPRLHNPAFRALVEENVKANVQKIARSAVMQDNYASLVHKNGSDANSQDESVMEVFIHGWVYDIENGKVSDLGVSVGPPGRSLPPSPFPPIARDYQA